MSYYNLYCGESENVNDESEGESEVDDLFSASFSSGLWDRTIVHVDVDCFYCQCEEVDGPADYKERPMAIGQKHIIVTSNYIARQYGVKKLQSRDAAYAACPNLLILEGSDLEHYRKHSRKIYLAFRDCLKQLAKQVGVEIQIKKGGMDENFADISALILKSNKRERPQSSFVYGESKTATSSLVEDQSGAEVIVNHQSYIAPHLNVHVNANESRLECQERLELAAALCEQVRQQIKDKTSFTVTIGVSVSKMLAKLASDLKKPNSLNILYPWRSGTVILPMPLRKIPELGHATLRLLKECLKSHHGREPKFWACQDLLEVPFHLVHLALKGIKSTEEASEDHCNMLLDKCRGLDRTPIEDDDGGLTKQVSVEDSFRRDTMTTREAVWQAVDELFVRLPILLEERRSASPFVEKAFPTTIRMTARVVDRRIPGRRRPFKTSSKQSNFDGKTYLSSDGQKRKIMLRNVIAPLLNSLVLENAELPNINVTRMNIAATNFQDLKVETSASISSFTSHGVKLVRSSHASWSRKRESEQAKPAAKLIVGGTLSNSMIDPEVLAQLPPDVASEVKQMYQQRDPKKKRKTIDSFFCPMHDTR